MNNKFKFLLAHLLLDKEGEINPLNFQNIKEWPTFTHSEDIKEPLELEYFEILEIKNEKLVIVCAGNWQSPVKVNIGMKENELYIDSSDFHEYERGIESDLLLALLVN